MAITQDLIDSATAGIDLPAVAPAPTAAAPEAPALRAVIGTIPEVPTVPGISQVTAPDIPAFTSTEPAYEGGAATDAFAFTPQAYASPVLAPLETRLLDDINVGGLGLVAADEDALFERERAAILAEAEATMLASVAQSAARGFARPTGDSLRQLLMAAQAAQAKLAAANREQGFARADQYQQGRQAAFSVALTAEQTARETWSAMIERDLDAAKAGAMSSLATYEANVSGLTSQLAGYKATAEAFSTRIDGIKIGVDLQALVAAAQIARGQAQIDSNSAWIKASGELLDAQKAAASAAADLYSGEVKSFTEQLEAITGLASADTAVRKANADAALSGVETQISYEVGVQKIDVAGQQLNSAHAISRLQIASAAAISAQQLASSEAISAAHLASSERIANWHNEASAALATITNMSRVHIASAASNSALRQAQAKADSEVLLADLRAQASSEMDGLTASVHDAEISKAIALQSVQIALSQS